MPKKLPILFIFVLITCKSFVFAQSINDSYLSGDKNLSGQNYQSAYNSYTLAIKRESNKTILAFLYNRRGVCLEGLRKIDAAIKDFNTAIALNPDNVDAHFNRAIVYDAQKNYASAIADLIKILSLNAKYRPNSNSFKGVALIYADIAFDEYKLGAINKGLYNDSLALSYDPQSCRGHLVRAEINAAQKKYKPAISDYNAAILYNNNTNNNGTAGLYYGRGYCELELNNNKAAINDFSYAISLNPDYGFAYWNRGAAYNHNGDYQLAAADYAKAIPYFKGDNLNLSNLYSDLAENEMRQNLFTQAVKDDSVAIVFAPQNTDAYWNRAFAYTSNGDYKQSNDIYIKIMDFYKGNNKVLAELHAQIADNEYFLGQYDKVIADCNTAILMDSTNYDPYYQRAEVYFKKKTNKLLALSDYNKVLTIDTSKKSTSYIFALYYTGKGDDALAILQNDILGTTNSVNVLGDYYNLACLYSLMNKPDEANTYLKKAIDGGYSKKYAKADEDLDNIRSTDDYKSTMAAIN